MSHRDLPTRTIAMTEEDNTKQPGNMDAGVSNDPLESTNKPEIEDTTSTFESGTPDPLNSRSEACSIETAKLEVMGTCT